MRSHSLNGRAPAKVLTAPVIAFVLASAGLGVVTVATLNPFILETDIVNRPIQIGGTEYVTSNTCQSCHPSEYATWYGSFHRTMTQIATPDTVRADFDGVTVTQVHGSPMILERHGDEFWAEFDDPGWEGIGVETERPRIKRQVVMITGSHHQNIYWYATKHERALNVLPGVYLLDEQHWTPRSAVVLHPPEQRVAMFDGHWNAICIACHTTQGKPKINSPYRSRPIAEQEVDTNAAEFGIACEACHGPAAEHVRANRNPLRRYGRYVSDKPDSTIVQPALLDPTRSSQVCGQCHGIWEFYDVAGERHANTEGLPYRPGDELRTTRFVAQPSVDRSSPEIQRLLQSDPEFVRGSFWPDGLVRVSGREYNGLIDSPCFRDATVPEQTLSCFSCHTMHKTPDDPRSVQTWATTHQISAGMASNDACLQCHESLGVNVPAHTNHTPTSAGSSCYNCHMPYTSYGLMRAVRSHTISKPSVQESIELGRPNACNLCHLDQTLAWTGEHLNNWYGTPIPPLNPDEKAVAASILWLMKGDAGLRAITSWHMGWQPAQAASGTNWMVPYVGELLDDPYDTVRYLASRALRSLPGYNDVVYDFVGERRERVASAVEVIRAWTTNTSARQRRDHQLLFNLDGSINIATMRRLLDERDTRPLFLRE